MKNFLIIISLLMLTSPTFFSLPAEATLISSDDPVFGTNSILRDTATGLDWLDINEATTLGKKYTEVKSLLGTADFAGFRFAQESELQILVNNSGYIGTDDQSDYSALSEIIDNIGPTRTITSGDFPNTIYTWRFLNGMLEPTIIEFEDYGGIFGATAYLHSIPIGEFFSLSSFNVTGGYGFSSSYGLGNTSFLSFPGQQDTTDDPYLGAFLVRSTPDFVPVPEPSTFILLGAGLAGLAIWRRKRS